MTLFNRLLNALKIAFVEDKCRPDLASMWFKGGTPDVRKTGTLFGHRPVKESPTEWLDVWLDGRMVEINGKGKIRVNKKKKESLKLPYKDLQYLLLVFGKFSFLMGLSKKYGESDEKETST